MGFDGVFVGYLVCQCSPSQVGSLCILFYMFYLTGIFSDNVIVEGVCAQLSTLRRERFHPACKNAQNSIPNFW